MQNKNALFAPCTITGGQVAIDTSGISLLNTAYSIYDTVAANAFVRATLYYRTRPKQSPALSCTRKSAASKAADTGSSTPGRATLSIKNALSSNPGSSAESTGILHSSHCKMPDSLNARWSSARILSGRFR